MKKFTVFLSLFWILGGLFGSVEAQQVSESTAVESTAVESTAVESTAVESTAEESVVTEATTSYSSPEEFLLDFLSTVQQLAIQDLEQNSSKEDRVKTLFKLSETYFNMDKIVRVVVGKHWKSFSDEQKKELKTVFRNYVIAKIIPTLNNHISGISEGSVKINRVIEKRKYYQIASEYTDPSIGKPVGIVWYVLKKEDSDSYKIFNVSIEGINFILIWKSEYSSFILKNKGGTEAYINKMKEEYNKEISVKESNSVSASM